MSAIGDWLTSGWSDAAAQWQAPLTSIKDGFNSLWGGPITAIPGSTSFPVNEENSGSSSITGYADGATVADTDSSSSLTDLFSGWQPWAIGVGILVAMVLVILLIHEFEEF